MNTVIAVTRPARAEMRLSGAKHWGSSVPLKIGLDPQIESKHANTAIRVVVVRTLKRSHKYFLYNLISGPVDIAFLHGML